jgi:cytochrome b subunit of formate dehydrogenase
VGVCVGQKGPAKKTDYGTVILHWLLVGSLVIAVATGLRIATESPDRNWINVLDFLLPKAAVWAEHLQAAVLFIATSIAYVVYVARAGLWQRLRLDTVRLRGLLGRRYARWGTINVFLHWLFFLVMLSQLVSGTLLYFGLAGSFLVQIHWIGTWVILGYVILHLYAQWRYGGAAQLLRIFRPGRIAAAPPRFDLAEMMALLDEQPGHAPVPNQSAAAKAFAGGPDAIPPFAPAVGERDVRRLNVFEREVAEASGDATGIDGPQNATDRRLAIHLNSFVLAGAVASMTVAAMLTSERQIIDRLYVHRIDRTEIPVIDGETSDPIWQRISPTYVRTANGGNFQGAGETTISIQAVHDELHAYFLFVWEDPTRSLKQLPLRKSVAGWELLHDGYEFGDEHAYSEDKFSVLLTSLNTILAGDTTFHAGAAPLAGEPATLSGRGLHYTMHEGEFVDVWEWKATSTNASKYCDDDHFGPPVEGTPAQFEALVPYHGGFAPDPGTANYQDNFTPFPASDHTNGVVPRRLPKDLDVLSTTLGRVDLNPDHGESETARWYMTEGETLPYSPERDRLIPNGTIVPGVIVSGEYSGDRADVRCAGRWAAGRWALEVMRRLDVQSRYDVPIKSGVSMRVAAFDHSQIRHTRHVRALRLEVE